jgi:hypothetical protein
MRCWSFLQSELGINFLGCTERSARLGCCPSYTMPNRRRHQQVTDFLLGASQIEIDHLCHARTGMAKNYTKRAMRHYFSISLSLFPTAKADLSCKSPKLFIGSRALLLLKQMPPPRRTPPAENKHCSLQARLFNGATQPTGGTVNKHVFEEGASMYLDPSLWGRLCEELSQSWPRLRLLELVSTRLKNSKFCLVAGTECPHLALQSGSPLHD